MGRGVGVVISHGEITGSRAISVFLENNFSIIHKRVDFFCMSKYKHDFTKNNHLVHSFRIVAFIYILAKNISLVKARRDGTLGGKFHWYAKFYF